MAEFSFNPTLHVQATAEKAAPQSLEEMKRLFQNKGAPDDAPGFLTCGITTKFVRKPPNSTAPQIVTQFMEKGLVDGETWMRATDKKYTFKYPKGDGIHKDLIEIRFIGPPFPSISEWGYRALHEGQIVDESCNLFAYFDIRCAQLHECLVLNTRLNLSSRTKVFSTFQKKKTVYSNLTVLIWPDTVEPAESGIPGIKVRLGVRKDRDDHIILLRSALMDQKLLLDLDTGAPLVLPSAPAPAPPASTSAGTAQTLGTAPTGAGSTASTTAGSTLTTTAGSTSTTTTTTEQPPTLGYTYGLGRITLTPRDCDALPVTIIGEEELMLLIDDALCDVLFSSKAEHLRFIEHAGISHRDDGSWTLCYSDPEVATFLVSVARVLTIVSPAIKMRFNITSGLAPLRVAVETVPVANSTLAPAAKAPAEDSTIPDEHGGASAGASRARKAPRAAAAEAAPVAKAPLKDAVAPVATPRRQHGGKKAAVAPDSPIDVEAAPPAPKVRPPRHKIPTTAAAAAASGDSSCGSDGSLSRRSVRLSLKQAGRTFSVHEDQLQHSPTASPQREPDSPSSSLLDEPFDLSAVTFPTNVGGVKPLCHGMKLKDDKIPEDLRDHVKLLQRELEQKMREYAGMVQQVAARSSKDKSSRTTPTGDSQNSAEFQPIASSAAPRRPPTPRRPPPTQTSDRQHETDSSGEDYDLESIRRPKTKRDSRTTPSPANVHTSAKKSKAKAAVDVVPDSDSDDSEGSGYHSASPDYGQ